MELFENLIAIKEYNDSKRAEELVDHRFLQDNGIEFYENGRGELIASTLDGYTKILVNIEQANDGRWFVTLPEEDINTTNRDLTMAIFDAVKQIDDFSLTESKRVFEKDNQLNERASMGQIDDIEEKIKDALGTEEMLEAICKALDYDTKADIYHYIWRMYGLDEEEEDGLEESKHLKEYKSNINNKTELWHEMFRYTDEPFVLFKDLFNCYSIDDLQDLYDYLSSEYEDEEFVPYKGKLNSIDELWDEMNKLVPNEKVAFNDLFNCYSLDKLKDLYDFLSSEYSDIDDLDEATSGIGAGSYTTKSIDLLPRKVYYNSIKESTNNLKLANMVNKIRKDNKLAESHKVYLEGLIKHKLKTSHLKEKNKNRNKK